MSLKMECNSKKKVIENGMSLKKLCHSNWGPLDITQLTQKKTQNVMTLKIECHSNRNVTQNGTSSKMEYH